MGLLPREVDQARDARVEQGSLGALRQPRSAGRGADSVLLTAREAGRGGAYLRGQLSLRHRRQVTESGSRLNRNAVPGKRRIKLHQRCPNAPSG